MDKCISCGADMICERSQGKEVCWCDNKPAILNHTKNPGCYCSVCLDRLLLQKKNETTGKE